ncbi:MAG: hypothetical protein R6V04_00780 [bacterium]
MFSDKKKVWIYAVVLLLFCCLLYSCTKQRSEVVMPAVIKGVKIYDFHHDFTHLFKQWKKVGINTAFVGLSLDSNKTFRKMAERYEIQRFLIVPIFYNPEFLHKNPDYYAVTSTGKKAVDDWVEFVCPTRAEYKKRKIQFIKDIIRSSNPDGLSIDFIRYFVFWEMVYPDAEIDDLPLTCFCNQCIEKFCKDLNIDFPGNFEITEKKKVSSWILNNYKKEWTEWKCTIITEMVKEVVHAAREIKPDIFINLHAVPWRNQDYNNAVKTVAGQDFNALSDYVDCISPMCYNHMVKRPASWIHSVVMNIQEESAAAVLPSIQVSKAYLDEDFSPTAFKKALIFALHKPSRGVVFWNWERLASSSEKLSIVKDIISDK